MNAPAHNQPDKSAPLAPLHVASAVTMIGMDWLMYAVNLLLDGRHVLPTALAGAVLCAVLVGWVEQVREPTERALARQKALVAGVAVVFPLPIVGATLGLVGLVWALLVATPRRKRAGGHH
jgi:hypothetical protein